MGGGARISDFFTKNLNITKKNIILRGGGGGGEGEGVGR